MKKNKTAKKAESSKDKTKKNLKKNFNIQAGWTGVSVLMLALMTLIALFFFLQSDYLSRKLVETSSTNETTKSETDIALENVSKHMLLLDKSNPLLVKIVDINIVKEKNPVFYKDAQNGDQLLIVDGKAIIYRPSSDLIINVAPFTMDKEQSSNTMAEEKKEIVKIAILNGTNNYNANTKLKDILKEKVTFDYTVTTDGIAPNDYPVTIVYDISVTGKGKTLADTLHCAYSTKLPQNIKTDADVVIVTGSDMF